MGHRLETQFNGFNPLATSPRFLPSKMIALLMMSVGLTVGSDAGQLDLTWQDNSDNEDGFEVERALMGEDFDLIATLEADKEAYTDVAVVPGLEYEYRVRAFNAFGYSGYTNVSQGVMPNTAPEIGEIESFSVLKGEALPVSLVPIADAESEAGELVFEAMSSNLALIPLENISIFLVDGVASVAVQPSGSGIGSAEITLLVSDGVEIAQKSFSVEVLKNLAPTISSLSGVAAYDGSSVGPIGFSVSDLETNAGQLTVSAVSLNEAMVDSSSIQITGTGSQRYVRFNTMDGASGSGIVRLQVSDGYNTTNGTLSLSVTANKAPTLAGLQDRYTIEDGGKLTGLSFSVGDFETSSSALEVSVSSSNALIVSSAGLKVRGTGAQRTLDISPNAGYPGSLEITVSVSDGIRVTEHMMTVRVLPPESVVQILEFTVRESLAVVEVKNRPGADFSLWKIHSRDGAWQEVSDVEVIAEGSSVILVDPTPIDAAVCYRVIASE